MRLMAKQERMRTLKGVTLIEMTLVLMILMLLIGVGFGIQAITEKTMRPREASEALRTVWTAQRMYLADHPLVAVEDLTKEMILPYMPNHATTIPQVLSDEGTKLDIKLNVFPPVIQGGGGSVYDPSGNSKDGLWDVGE